jgi:hypothetical protein
MPQLRHLAFQVTHAPRGLCERTCDVMRSPVPVGGRVLAVVGVEADNPAFEFSDEDAHVGMREYEIRFAVEVGAPAAIFAQPRDVVINMPTSRQLLLQ